MATAVAELHTFSEDDVLGWHGEQRGGMTLSRAHSMPFGAEVQPDGDVRFRLFAPKADHVEVAIEGRGETIPMLPSGKGWHELLTADAGPGSLYRFVLPDGSRVADPASRFQPQDVNGPSEVVAPGSYIWRDGAWTGVEGSGDL